METKKNTWKTVAVNNDDVFSAVMTRQFAINWLQCTDAGLQEQVLML